MSAWRRSCPAASAVAHASVLLSHAEHVGDTEHGRGFTEDDEPGHE
jgi:hypothetical protein